MIASSSGPSIKGQTLAQTGLKNRGNVTTDIDSAALARAREGIYPAAIETDVDEQRLRRYFTREGDHYRIRREIRDMVLFANHSLLRDPPFSRIDLASCRNVLIYLDRELQQQVMTTLHYALKPGRYLLLGSSETADTPPGLFRSLDRDARIYQAHYSDSKIRELPRLLITPKVGQIPVFDAIMQPSVQPRLTLHIRSLEQAAPPSMIVNANFQVVHLSDTAGRFVQPSAGALRNDVTEIIRPELRFDLRAGLARVFERNETSLSLPIPVQFNGHQRRVYLQVRPVLNEQETAERNALVFFLEGEEIGNDGPEPLADTRNDKNNQVLRRLKEELEITRARLRASREEQEAATEELRAANEELQSINEEYRSAAEELETSKEELQSMNEELQTVNAELKTKLEGVSRSNNDLQNLMSAADVGTLFLDPSLRIKRFTPRIADLFNVTTLDEGRYITDFTNRLDYPSFMQDANTVLRDLGTVQREVSSNGRWYLTRLRPYRTDDDRIEGVVCTFVDVTDRMHVEQALKKSEANLRLLLSELSHRVKNTLTVVQSMARQTFRDDVPRTESMHRYSARLVALSVAHDLLVASDWGGADLADLVTRQLAPFVGNRTERLRMRGPTVLLPPDVATRFGLTLHELGTNALKHGALSTPEGTVEVRWAFKSKEAEDELKFEWIEKGGPSPAPGKSGFGTFLIEQGVTHAKVEKNFKKSGLELSIVIPIATEVKQRG